MLLWINVVTLKMGRRSQGKVGPQLSLDPLEQPLTWSRVVANATAGQGRVTNPASSSILAPAWAGDPPFAKQGSLMPLKPAGWLFGL